MGIKSHKKSKSILLYRVTDNKVQLPTEAEKALQAREKELLESRSLVLRKYLFDNVIPALAEGLIEVCKEQPENATLFLVSC